MKICSESMCTGCCSCLNICPQNCISMIENALGKTIPFIRETDCIACGLCINCCPNNKKTTFFQAQHCYAALSKESADKQNCSSGGVATVLSRKVVTNGGVVYGAAFDDTLTLVTTRVDQLEKLSDLAGSKYVQSYIGTAYRKIKQDLIDEKSVLFIGTPCQVDGLYSFLSKPYNNLLTVDLVCHGTPPIKYLKEYVKHVGGKLATNVKFRGENDFFLTVFKSGKVVYKKQACYDMYFLGFLKGLFYRDNCYNCPYAQIKRVADITLGDFWGLDKNSLQNVFDGRISLVLPNTEKGNICFNECKELFIWENRSIQEAVAGNEQLRRPFISHPDRKIFERLYPQKGFIKTLKQTSICKESKSSQNLKIRLKSKLKIIVKRLIRPFLTNLSNNRGEV